MADVIPHFCTGTGCEALHGSGESPEVKIAKINADRDIKVAELSRSSDRAWNDASLEETKIRTEAETEQTEILASAAVDEAVVENEVLKEIVNPDPEPVQVEITEPDPGPEEVQAPPETEPADEEPKSKGWWSGYR